MKTKHQQIFLIILTAILIEACANTGYPEGGIKDIIPPKIEKSTPAANSVNFKGKEISIQFDELIKIEGMDEKFVSSPPLKKRPTIAARGRNLVVKFDEPLQDNATYTLDFADAISDNNEGNKLADFRFSFSTGTQIDSFAISGNVFDAKTLSPVGGSLVLLYKNLSDTAFTTEVPLRLAKTDAKGFFSIHNIAEGAYRVFALKDANRNYFFDQPGEEIAWNKETFSPSIEYQTIKDTTLLKTLAIPDSTKIDTLATKKVKVNLPNNLLLFMYQQDFKKQYLENELRKERSKIELCFSRPVDGKIDFRLQSDTLRSLESWAIQQNSLNHDTISFYITDTLISNIDSLAFSLKYNTTDSLNRPYLKVDSFATFYFDLAVKKKKPRKAETIERPSLSMGGMPNSHDIYLPYPIILGAPAVKFNKEGIKLFERRDTINTQIPFELIKDTILATRFFIKNKWDYKLSYVLSIDSATFSNSYSLANNALDRKFDIKQENSYGIILLTLLNSQENALVQLIDTKENIIRQQYAPKNGKMAFQLLKPGDYFIKIVDDANRNKKQDLGNYQTGIMPESIMYYPEKISVRANWRLDVKWDVVTWDIYKFVKAFRPDAKKEQ